MFQAMLITDTQRGEDSTGAFVVNRDGSSDSIKIASNPFNLFACKEWGTFRSKAISYGRMLVGHNRKATQGGISSENAHPFTEGKIVLVHNGTLRNHKSFKTDKDVDSHAIAHAFNAGDHEEVLSKIDGAFTFVWYNIETEKLYMIRNSERPLWFIETKDTLAFASEGWMAAAQFQRSNEVLTDARELPEGILHEFDLKGNLTTKKIELYKAPPFVYTGKSYHSKYTPTQEEINATWDSYNNDIPDTSCATVTTSFAPFKVKDTIQVSIDRVERTLNHATNKVGLKAFGTAQELGKPEWEFVGWLAEGTVSAPTEKEWIQYPCTGEVTAIVASNCGPSLWLTDIAIDDITETFADPIGSWTFSKIVDSEKCSKCKSSIDYRDAIFTSINVKKSNVRIHCAKCVADGMPIGDVRNAFIQRRNAAIQSRKPVSQSPSNHPLITTGPQSTPSIH